MKDTTRNKAALFILSGYLYAGFLLTLLVSWVVFACVLATYAVSQPRDVTQDELATLVGSLDPSDNPLPPEVETPSGICLPSITLKQDESGVICGNFLDYLDAERNFYHCQEGVAIMGAAIYQLDNSFIPVLSTEEFAARSQASNVGQPNEIYPSSGILPFHNSWVEAEVGHDACTLTNFQYWDYLQFLMKQAEEVKFPFVDAGKFADGRNGFLYKPLGDENASCRGRATVGGDSALNGFIPFPASFVDRPESRGVNVYDVNANLIGYGWFKGYSNPDRPFYCLSDSGSRLNELSQGLGLWVEFIIRDAPSFGKFVTDPTKRED